jgi:hypothetical protein
MSDDKKKPSSAWGDWSSWFDDFKVVPPITKESDGFFGNLLTWIALGVLIVVCVRLGAR